MTFDGHSMVARLRSEVASDLADQGAHALAPADRRELARRMTLTRLRLDANTRVAAGIAPLGPDEEQQVAREVLDALFGLGRLQQLIDDSTVENIDVNGCDDVWVTYATGEKRRWHPVATSDDELVEMLRSAAVRFGLSERRFDTSHPELDLRLPDGSRLSALMAVTRRPSVSIRRHRYVDLSLDDLVHLGTVDGVLASFLRAAVRARKNIVVGGAMNAGKTTLIRALAAEIPRRERIVTIEQALELGLDMVPSRFPDVVALEARQANAEGEGDISMTQLVRRASRMNADRVIVGEVLGAEVLPMLNAMGQGRAGSLCTIHADSSAGVFRRLATYAAQAVERLPLESTYLLIAGAVHFAVHIDAVDDVVQGYGNGLGANDQFEGVHRRRFVSSVREVVDADGPQMITNEVFRPGPTGLAVPGAPMRTETLEDLLAHGYQPGAMHRAVVGGTPW
ncbi:MAG TPA: ATPase, T2SS/T4P/T4SS family [Acidimicrobiales bacterium]|nr:ATPase, T2SS/T4P/T4SS family [Acidimicrobiales bacterium]